MFIEMILWHATLTVLLFPHCNIATLSFDVANDVFRDCENGKPKIALDFSEIEIISEDDGSITLNGSTSALADYNSPFSIKLYSKKLERGIWLPGLVSRNVPNLCEVLLMPYEAWYPITRTMQQKSCPYRKGHEEQLHNVNIGNYAEMLQIPPSFIGEWRMYYEITTVRNGIRVEECLMIPVTISEV